MAGGGSSSGGSGVPAGAGGCAGIVIPPSFFDPLPLDAQAPQSRVEAILADSGVRYASKLFNPAFLRSKNLPVPAWLERKAAAPRVFLS